MDTFFGEGCNKTMTTVTAPFRIDLAGGVTDIPELRPFIQTAIVNLGLNIHEIDKPDEMLNVAVSFTTNYGNGTTLKINGTPVSLDNREGEQDKFISTCVRKLLVQDDVVISVRTLLPASTGLGGSSLIATCLIAGHQWLQTKRVEAKDVLPSARRFETKTMKIRGGFQDYIGAYYGGANFIDFTELTEENIVRSRNQLGQKVRQDLVRYLDANMFVIMLKQPCVNSDVIVRDEVAAIQHNESKRANLKIIQNANKQLWEIIHDDDEINVVLEKIGNLIKQSWYAQQRLSSLIGGNLLREVEAVLSPHCFGLRGPGAGGNSLFGICKRGVLNKVRDEVLSFGPELLFLTATVNQRGLEITTQM